MTDANGGVVSYECRHLVLATGSSDKAGCLEVPGETLSYITHKLRHFEELLTSKNAHDLQISPARAGSSAENAEKPKSVPRTISNGHLPSNASSVSHCHSGRRKGSIEMGVGDRNGWTKEKSQTHGNEPNKSVGDPEMSAKSDMEKDGYRYKYSDDQTSANSSESDFDLGEEDLWVGENIPIEREMNVSFGVMNLNGGREGKEKEENQLEIGDRRVLIVGAGLSAADAIVAAWRKNYSVVHAFRNPLTTTKLPAVMYPEYHEVFVCCPTRLPSFFMGN